MRSHWTNPTTIRRPAIAVMSAAALLVACDQPTDPASRPGGGIRANNATAGTVSAKGNGQVSDGSECALPSNICTFGGQGAEFSFAFSGEPTVTGQMVVPVTGALSLKFRATGDVVQFVSGPATITPSAHTLDVEAAVCTLTTAAGVTSGSCRFFATEFAQPNSGNELFFQFVGPTASAFAGGQVISGGMQID
jgi:hypothetical protein